MENTGQRPELVSILNRIYKVYAGLARKDPIPYRIFQDFENISLRSLVNANCVRCRKAREASVSWK